MSLSLCRRPPCKAEAIAHVFSTKGATTRLVVETGDEAEVRSGFMPGYSEFLCAHHAHDALSTFLERSRAAQSKAPHSG